MLRKQGEEIIEREPCLAELVSQAILNHASFGEALAWRLAHKLGGPIVKAELLFKVFLECLQLSREMPGKEHDIEQLAMQDLIAVEERDPACRSVASVLLYFKGYKAIQCYRMAHILWVHDRKDLAMVIQGECAEVFGVDIHPGAVIGGGLMIDHGTGVVLGETCVIGNGCTFMHGITLGGTGKSTTFDRHPKIGNNVFLGCQCTVLGNIRVGNNVVVGSGSLVLSPLEDGVTAVGSPAAPVKKASGENATASTRDSSKALDKVASPSLAPSLPSKHLESLTLVPKAEGLASDSTIVPPALGHLLGFDPVPAAAVLFSAASKEECTLQRCALKLWSGTVWWPKIWGGQ